MTRLVALTANGFFSALASNVTALSAFAAYSSIRANAGNMTRLTAIVAKSLVGAVTSYMTHLSAVMTGQKLGRTSRTSLTRTITSEVAKSSTVKAFILSLTAISTL